jgi:SAM-dependent methyltransferase
MKFYVSTDCPVALDSFDHQQPRGTKIDNSKNLDFNRKLIAMIPHKPVSVLDIGCAGGGMVKTFIDAGQIAVGIEGSDYSKNIKRAAWGTNPESLFTADATKPFSVFELNSRNLFKFDVVTAWEFFEHIIEADLPAVIDNIIRHIKVGGLLIGSINTSGSTKWHPTIHRPEWWFELFERSGFELRHDLISYFSPDWVRMTPTSFGVVMNFSPRDWSEQPDGFPIDMAGTA